MIRRATMEDRPHFLRLWASFLEDQRKLGSHMLPSRNNLYRSLDSFEAWIRGDRYGICLFWEPEGEDPVGIIMGGSDPVPSVWETDMGEVPALWGLYLEPSYRGKGIGAKLTAATFEDAIKWGMDYFETYVLVGNSNPDQLMKGFVGKPYINRYLICFKDANNLRENN